MSRSFSIFSGAVATSIVLITSKQMYNIEWVNERERELLKILETKNHDNVHESLRNIENWRKTDMFNQVKHKPVIFYKC